MRRKTLLVALALAVAALPALALAADAGVTSSSGSVAPAGSAKAPPHPSVSATGSASSSAAPLPSGHPEVTPPMPQGHPEMEEEEPGLPNLPRDVVREDPSVPAGTIVVQVRDEKAQPVANQVVNLGILRTSVAQGEAKSRTTGTTDAAGNVTFANLEKGSGWAYRVTVVANAPEDPSAMATYGSEPFPLPLDKGYRVVVHKFPVAASIDKLLAAVEGVDTIVELHDDVVDVQQLFDVINAGTTTWGLGKGLLLGLPKGFKAIRAAESMGDQQVIPMETGARWTGSFPPGRTRVAYDFKVPYDGDPSFDVEVELPPRVLAARVRIPVKKGMTMSVDGFPAAVAETTATGVKVLSTLKQGTPQDPIRTLRIHVAGIPTSGPDRWIATLGALLAAAFGLGLAIRTPAEQDRVATASARARRRRRILDEIRELDRAHRREEIGPKAWERERAKLVDQLAGTLEPVTEPRAARA